MPLVHSAVVHSLSPTDSSNLNGQRAGVLPISLLKSWSLLSSRQHCGGDTGHVPVCDFDLTTWQSSRPSSRAPLGITYTHASTTLPMLHCSDSSLQQIMCLVPSTQQQMQSLATISHSLSPSSHRSLLVTQTPNWGSKDWTRLFMLSLNRGSPTQPEQSTSRVGDNI